MSILTGTASDRAATFGDYGIAIAWGSTGEVRTLCPHCSHTRRKSSERCLAVNVDTGTWYCHHCQWTGHLPISRKPANLSRRLAKRVFSQPTDIATTSEDVSSISRISRGVALFAGARRWDEAQPLVSHDPVWRYLCARAIEPSAPLAALRYHRRLPYRHEDGTWTYHPAMIAAVTTLGGALVSLHRTYLDRDGHKADVPSPKKLMQPTAPGMLRGASIHLFPATTILAVTEGIETALAVHRLSGWPTWACISATGLEHAQIPHAITELYVCADHDPIGLQAAYSFARYHANYRTVKVVVPPCPGDDWNDVLQREGV